MVNLIYNKRNAHERPDTKIFAHWLGKKEGEGRGDGFVCRGRCKETSILIQCEEILILKPVVHREKQFCKNHHDFKCA